MNDFDDLDQLERDFGPALRTTLRHVASQIRPEDVPRLDSGEILTGYVTSPSLGRPLPDEPRRAPRRGALLVGALSVAAAVVAVAVLYRPSHDASPIQSPTTTSAPAQPTTTSPPVPPDLKTTGYLLDVATGKRTPLPAGLDADFIVTGGYVPSPDGTRVAFIGCTPGATLCVNDRMAIGNIDGSNVRPIAPPDGTRLSAPGPSWSPDGTKIVYHARDDSTGLIGELFIQDVTTGARIQLTHLGLLYSTGEFPMSPTFTRDGQSVLFQLPPGSRYAPGVWSVPVTGGEPTLMIEDAFWPTPLPDGKTIAYVSGDLVGISVIAVASIDDPGSARTLTDGAFIFGMTASPDGTRLAYHRDAQYGHPGGTYVVDIATGAVTNVSAGTGWLDNDTLIGID